MHAISCDIEKLLIFFFFFVHLNYHENRPIEKRTSQIEISVIATKRYNIDARNMIDISIVIFLCVLFSFASTDRMVTINFATLPLIFAQFKVDLLYFDSRWIKRIKMASTLNAIMLQRKTDTFCNSIIFYHRLT